MHTHTRTTDLRGLDELLVLHQRAAQRMGLVGVLHAAAAGHAGVGVLVSEVCLCLCTVV